MTEQRDIIDFTYLEPPKVSRWDRGDGAGAVRTLVEALDRAGLPGQLQASLRLLEAAEALGDQASSWPALIAASPAWPLVVAAHTLAGSGDTELMVATTSAQIPWRR